MSQPPPPQEPPPGGFGPPKDPRSGAAEGPSGYGYPPNQPPGQPGYGYPQGPVPGQAPQTPPGAAPSYGYPGQPQPQPGYGYPGQQPYGQPQYGMYPPPGDHPGGFIPPGGGQSKQRMMIIVSAVVAVLLVIVGGVWYASSSEDTKKAGPTTGGGGGGSDDGGGTDPAQGGGGRPADADAKAILQIPYPTSIPADSMSVTGHWATAKTYAKPHIYSIIGYRADTGKQSWKLPLAGQICASSKHVTADGRTAVIFQERRMGSDSSSEPCSQIAVIDLDSGKKLWQRKLPSKRVYSSGMNMTISGNTVAAAWIGGSAAYGIDGKELWKSDEYAKCKVGGYAGGKALIAVTGCPSGVSGPFKVEKIDPSSGKPEWTFDAPSGIKSVNIVSTDPVVIAIGAGSSLTTDLMTLDDKGKLRSRVSIERGEDGQPKYDPNCSLETESCMTVAVDDKHLYLPSREHQGKAEYGRTNEIIAFDLGTGKPAWKSDAGEKRTIMPLRMDGETLIAYRLPTYDSGGQIVGVDTRTGKQTVYLRMPNDTAESESRLSPDYNSALYMNGRLFLSGDTLSKHSTTRKDLAIGFGS